jgi:hypothetical protein
MGWEVVNAKRGLSVLPRFGLRIADVETENSSPAPCSGIRAAHCTSQGRSKLSSTWRNTYQERTIFLSAKGIRIGTEGIPNKLQRMLAGRTD